jgi:hypothetical protein
MPIALVVRVEMVIGWRVVVALHNRKGGGEEEDTGDGDKRKYLLEERFIVETAESGKESII